MENLEYLKENIEVFSTTLIECQELNDFINKLQKENLSIEELQNKIDEKYQVSKIKNTDFLEIMGEYSDYIVEYFGNDDYSLSENIRVFDLDSNVIDEYSCNDIEKLLAELNK